MCESWPSLLTFATSPPLISTSQWVQKLSLTSITSCPLRRTRPRYARIRTVQAVAAADVDKPSINSNDNQKQESLTPPSIFVQKTFSALGLSPDLVSALESSSITQPTGIQSRVIPTVLGGADVIMGAATGSGKTLAYLLPVVQMLKQAEAMQNPEDPPLRILRRLRAIILVPTRELAEQVVAVAKDLSHVAKFRVVSAIGGGAGLMKKVKNQLAVGPVDVLVATTGRLCQLLDERLVDIRFVSHVVIDEVDTMFDAGFSTELKRILKDARGSSTAVNKPQYIAAGATHPRIAEQVYLQEFPTAKRVNVDLHRTPPGLEQRFISVTSNTKIQELMSFLGEASADGSLRGGRMIVFCNTIDSCRFLDHFLNEGGYTTACIHGDVPPIRRDAAYAEFKGGKKQLLVCTDMAARGLDNLQVDHVVLFDFPNSAVDYLHRAGRTARAGAKGRVTSFVTKRDMRLAKAVEKAGFMDDALECARMAREQEEMRKRKEAEAARTAAIGSRKLAEGGGRRSRMDSKRWEKPNRKGQRRVAGRRR